MAVLLYQDYKHNNARLYRALQSHYGSQQVAFCDAGDILAGCLNTDIGLFVMPGGADLYFCEKLNGDGNKKIRHWVEQGGCYLGLCAGAYYGCAEISWERNNPDKEQDICGPRELAFFPGTATGPVYELIEKQDSRLSWQGAPVMSYQDESLSLSLPVFYEGGPVFYPAPDAPSESYKVLGRYENLPAQPAALVECYIGKGKALLCSPHLEETATSLHKRLYKHDNPSYSWERAVKEQLEEAEAENRKLWSHLLERCLSKETAPQTIKQANL